MDSWTRQPRFLTDDFKKGTFYNNTLSSVLPMLPNAVHVILCDEACAEQEIVPNLPIFLDKAGYFSLQKVVNSLCVHGFDLSMSQISLQHSDGSL